VAPPVAAAAPLLRDALALAADPVPNVRLALARLLARAVHAALGPDPAPCTASSRDGDSPAGPGTPPGSAGGRGRRASARGAGPAADPGLQALAGTLERLSCGAAPDASGAHPASAAGRSPPLASAAADPADAHAYAACACGGGRRAACGADGAGSPCGAAHKHGAGSWVAGALGEVAGALERLGRDRDMDVADMAAAGLGGLARLRGCRLCAPAQGV
jgi:hypothetical protein